jgi:hypothetical protein
MNYCPHGCGTELHESLHRPEHSIVHTIERCRDALKAKLSEDSDKWCVIATEIDELKERLKICEGDKWSGDPSKWSHAAQIEGLAQQRDAFEAQRDTFEARLELVYADCRELRRALDAAVPNGSELVNLAGLTEKAEARFRIAEKALREAKAILDNECGGAFDALWTLVDHALEKITEKKT